MSLFQCQDLIYYYPDRKKPALNQINLQIEEGEFLLLIGGSGSGKSSLARVLAGLIPEFYGGRFGGQVYFQNRNLKEFKRRNLVQEIGIVFQDPEKQLVMAGVEAEVAFGLENLGLPPREMLRRVAEVMSFMDLEGVKQEFTAQLSGGLKQKLALASVLAMYPRVLILDEPTSQLDPVAAEAFFNLIKQLNEEIGLTIVLIEQRLERCFHLADRILLLEDGQIRYNGSPEKYSGWANARKIPLVPPVGNLLAQLGFSTVPLTIKKARQLLQANYNLREPSPLSTRYNPLPVVPVKANFKDGLTLKKVWFTYPRGKEALRDINLQISTGELVAILGANGAGKTTLLKVAVGLLSPGRGQVLVPETERLDGRKKSKKNLGKRNGLLYSGIVAYLAQNPNDYLFHDTVEEELLFSLKNFQLEDQGRIEAVLNNLDLKKYRETNPRDLSSGERQRVALASLLVTQPRFLLLDEPTRGMDYGLKREMGRILTELVKQGLSVLVVTHDVEFAALYASRVIMMFDGQIISDGPVGEVLGQSFFYTTQIGKMCRGLVDGILTLPQALDRFESFHRKVKTGGEVG